jgi:uncharacterized membrane protein
MSYAGQGPSLPKRIALVPLALLYVAAGVNHFVNPPFYEAIMPPYLPLHRELVLLSGAIEVALGVLVAIPATRRLAAWGLVLLLIAVFPANLHMAMADVGGYGWKSWLRLPVQLPLIAWAWWFTRKD